MLLSVPLCSHLFLIVEVLGRGGRTIDGYNPFCSLSLPFIQLCFALDRSSLTSFSNEEPPKSHQPREAYSATTGLFFSSSSFLFFNFLFGVYFFFLLSVRVLFCRLCDIRFVVNYTPLYMFTIMRTVYFDGYDWRRGPALLLLASKHFAWPIPPYTAHVEC